MHTYFNRRLPSAALLALGLLFATAVSAQDDDPVAAQENDPATAQADDPTAAESPSDLNLETDLTDELAKQAIAAKDDFQPITPEQVAAARKALAQAADNLERMFQRGDDAYEKNWKDFLHWDDLEAGLAAEEPDYAALAGVFDRFRINQVGNEMEKFTRTRDALEAYLNLSYGESQENLQEAYGQILDRLAARLQRQNAKGT